MDVRILRSVEDAEDVEVARANRILIGTGPGWGTPNVLWQNGWLTFNNPGTELKVRLFNYKTPEPPFSPSVPAGVNGGIFSGSSNREIRNLEAIVMTLVNMLGGAVTIHQHEVESTISYNMTATNYQDPPRFVINVTPKR